MSESHQKKVIALIGKKGSGKSTIGHLIASEFHIQFLRVEPIFLAVRSELGPLHPQFEQRGFDIVFNRLAESLADCDTVCFESTGTSVHFPALISRLSGIACVVPVHVVADDDVCLRRVQTRDPSTHIPVSDDQVEQINKLSGQVQLPWAFEIDNRGALREDSILDAIRHLLTWAPLQQPGQRWNHP